MRVANQWLFFFDGGVDTGERTGSGGVSFGAPTISGLGTFYVPVVITPGIIMRGPDWPMEPAVPKPRPVTGRGAIVFQAPTLDGEGSFSRVLADDAEWLILSAA